MVSWTAQIHYDTTIWYQYRRSHISIFKNNTLPTELDQFQSSELQDRDDYKDTEHILNMLRHQKELKSEMKDYQQEHHKATYMDDAWNNNSPGLGLGLW